jgi:alpha-N-acetylglucosaminidase
MSAVDSKAKWVMQGWIFVYSGSDFWGETQTKALLNAVPDGNLIILDLWGDHKAAWDNKNAFYGKDWIWCMLHNFGGNNLMHGRMETIAKDPSNVKNNPSSGNMAGIGLTMEAIEQNPAIYSLMLENVWNDQPIDVDAWLKRYTLSRYGKNNADANKAWEILKNTVYSNERDFSARSASIIAGRPTLKKDANWTYTTKKYKTNDLLPAFDYMIRASKDLEESDGFRYDLIEVTKQVLANYADTIQRQFAASYFKQDFDSFAMLSQKFLGIISDLDELVGTRKESLLGTWINDAQRSATDESEIPLFTRNAKNLLTTWGPKNSDILDYSWRIWSGLLDDYYKQRWALFFNHIEEGLARNGSPSLRGVENKLMEWEWEWINSPKTYPTEPKGDEIEIATRLYKKYIQELRQTFPENR